MSSHCLHRKCLKFLAYDTEQLPVSGSCGSKWCTVRFHRWTWQNLSSFFFGWGEIICLKSKQYFLQWRHSKQKMVWGIYTYFHIFSETDIFMCHIVIFKIFLPHSIHGTGIFTIIYLHFSKKTTIHVSKHTSPMDCMGTDTVTDNHSWLRCLGGTGTWSWTGASKKRGVHHLPSEWRKCHGTKLRNIFLGGDEMNHGGVKK